MAEEFDASKPKEFRKRETQNFFASAAKDKPVKASASNTEISGYIFSACKVVFEDCEESEVLSMFLTLLQIHFRGP